MISLQAAKQFITEKLWILDLSHLPRWKAWPLRTLRLLLALTRDISEGDLTLRAMSLVYTTLLSLVPLLAVSFSVLKAFGVHNQIEPMLMQFLAPFGAKGQEIALKVVEFVENMKVGILGTVGLALLLYTVVGLIQKIENAFNFTWHVKQSRSLPQRFSGYLSVIIIGPVLVFSALGLTASLMSTSIMQQILAIEPFGHLAQFVAKLTPYLLVIAAFTFFYMFIPNTKVYFRSAFFGAVIAGVLWQTSGWAFAVFIVSSTKYTAIYSAFATVIMFMIWLYLTWLIVLVGADIAFYLQHPNYLSLERRAAGLSIRVKERLGLLAVFLIAHRYYHNKPGWSVESMADRLNVPMDMLMPVLNALEKEGVIARTGDEQMHFVPAMPPDTTTIEHLLNLLRATGEGSSLNMERLPVNKTVDDLMSSIDRGVSEALQGMTVKDLALTEELSMDDNGETTEKYADKT